jgi:hypothetical protein
MRNKNLMSVRGARCVYAHDRKAYKQRQCFHLVLNTMFTTRLPNFSIDTKVDKSRVKTMSIPRSVTLIAQEKLSALQSL